jgi:hypothetical protein
MIGERYRYRVDRRVVEDAAEVADGFGSAADPFELFAQPLLVDVANIRYLSLLERREGLGVFLSLIARADNRDADALIGAGDGGARAGRG